MNTNSNKDPRRICFFNTTKAWGGGEKWHFDNAKHLFSRNYQVIVATHAKSALNQRVQKTDIPCFGFSINNLSFLNIFKILKIKKFLQKQQIHTLVMNLSADVKTAGVAAKLAGVKRIIYRRGSAIPIKNSISNRFLFSKIINEILCNSQETKHTIVKNNAKLFPAENLWVIYNGIDLEEYDERKSKPLIEKENDILYLGNAGRMVEQKGQDILLEVAAVLKQRDIQFKLLIAGDGKLEKSLKEKAAHLKLNENVIFTGFLSNIKDLMRSIDVFVLSSHWEGFGYVLAEAMACEKPVVAFDISSNPEIVQHNHTGFLVRYPDKNKMAEKICELYQDKDLRQKMGQEGRRRCESKFDFKKNIKQVEHFLFPGEQS